MRKRISFFLLLGFICGFIAYTQPAFAQENSTDPSSKQEYNLSDYEKEVITLVNKEREKRDLKPLLIDEKASKLAREKSEDMRDNNYFDHQSPTYGDPCKHMQAEGVPYSYCGENIAAGYKTPEEVMEAWMKSKGHRENILNEHYTHIGVGYAEGGQYETYWTQQFWG